IRSRARAAPNRAMIKVRNWRCGITGPRHLGRHRRGRPPRPPDATDHRHGPGTVTGWMTTGPRVGPSSVAWETPAGVITSTASVTEPGSAEHTAADPPGAQTPNRNPCAGCEKPRAWSELNPSWPVSTTENPHPAAGVPNADSGTAMVIVLSACT